MLNNAIFLDVACSLAMVEHLSNLNQEFRQKSIKTAECVRSLRISVVKAKNDFSVLDSSLGLIFLSDSVIKVSLIMSHIYVCIFTQQTTGGLLALAFLFSSLMDLIKLAVNCVVHGMVGEEADRLFAALNELEVNYCGSEDLFKEVMYLKSISDMKIGFSIGGVVPYRKITLLSVIIRAVVINVELIYLQFIYRFIVSF